MPDGTAENPPFCEIAPPLPTSWFRLAFHASVVGTDEMPRHPFNASRQVGGRFQPHKHPPRHPRNDEGKSQSQLDSV
jgi:hypothetical protein